MIVIPFVGLNAIQIHSHTLALIHKADNLMYFRHVFFLFSLFFSFVWLYYCCCCCCWFALSLHHLIALFKRFDGIKCYRFRVVEWDEWRKKWNKEKTRKKKRNAMEWSEVRKYFQHYLSVYLFIDLWDRQKCLLCDSHTVFYASVLVLFLWRYRYRTVSI